MTSRRVSLPALEMLVYIGTYTQTTSKGIYVLHFDPADGSISSAELAAEAQNPTWLSLDPSGTHLYATGELKLDPKPDKPVGGASAFAVDRSSGRLRFLNQEATGAGAPPGATTHNVVDQSDRMLIAVSYGAGYVAALPIRPDGSLGPRSAFIDQHGRAPLGPNTDRQKQAHAHSVTLSPDNRFAFVCDLGLDRVFIYRVDPAAAGLSPNDPPAVAGPPGAGPRHSRFSPDGRFFYVINEMGGSVSTYAYDAQRGALALKDTVSTLPADFKGQNTDAEVRLSPDGRFLYASNRGHDSIAVFSRDAENGSLRKIGIVPCGGKHPRNFALDPSGRWLLCANRDTDNVVVFEVDPASGRLTATGRETKVAMPVCVLFAP